MNLQNHTAIISGGLGDIGRAIGWELTKNGANVAVCDLHEPDQAAPYLAELRNTGGRARYDRVDVGDADAVKEWIAAVEADLGVPDLIVPNAAIVDLVRFRKLTPEQWERHLRVNLSGAFYMAQAAVNRLLALKRPGRVVFIGSWVGHAPQTHIPAYCVTKAGLRMLCRCMALDLAPHGILVNELAPGNVDAGLSAQVFRERPALREKSLERVPIRQHSTAEDIARQVAYLCDPENTQITGSTLLVDGGLSLLSGQFGANE